VSRSKHNDREEHPKVKHFKQFRLGERQNNNPNKLGKGNAAEDAWPGGDEGKLGPSTAAIVRTVDVGLYDVCRKLHCDTDRHDEVYQGDSV